MTTRMKTFGELLREFPFFAGLDDKSYDALLARGQGKQYEKGETIFLEGEPCQGLFLIQTGAIKIYRLSETGREQIFEIHRDGQGFAELPVFDGGAYPASATAMEDSTVLFIPKAAINELLLRNPQLCRTVVTMLAQRLRKMVELVANLSLFGVRQRLAKLLLEESAGAREFPLRYTNEELAARLGSVRDVISRTLSALQADEIIRLKGRHVTIVDLAQLRMEAE